MVLTPWNSFFVHLLHQNVRMELKTRVLVRVIRYVMIFSLLFGRFWTNVHFIYILFIGCIGAVSAYIGALVSFTCFARFLSLSPRDFSRRFIQDSNGQKHSEQTEKIGNVLVTKLEKLCVQLCACAVSACAMCIDNSLFVFSKHFKSSKNSILVHCILRTTETGRQQFNGNFFRFIQLAKCHQTLEV